MFRYFVLKDFNGSSLISENHNLSTEDIEGIIHSINPLSEKVLDEYVTFLKNSYKFLKEYEITWCKGVLIEGSGDIYSTYSNMCSLKSLNGLKVWYFDINQLTECVESMKQIKTSDNKSFDTLEQWINTMVIDYGRLFLVSKSTFDILNKRNLTALSASNNQQTENNSGDKKKENNPVVSNASKNTNPLKAKKVMADSMRKRFRDRFMSRIGR